MSKFTKNQSTAQTAVRELQKLSPGLSSYATAIANNGAGRGRPRKLTVVPGSNTHTDGKIIYVRPPASLAFRYEHDFNLCRIRNEDTGILECAACNQMEELYTGIYHEISHVVNHSFDSVVLDYAEIDALRVKIKAHALPDFAEVMIGKLNASIRGGRSFNSLKISDEIHKGIGNQFNQVCDDIRIDHLAWQARPGVAEMSYWASVRTMRDGIELPDGRAIMWSDSPLELQVSIGVLQIAEGIDIAGTLDQAALDLIDALDPELYAPVQTITEVFTQGLLLICELNKLSGGELYRYPEQPPLEHPDESDNSDGDSDDQADAGDSGESSESSESSESGNSQPSTSGEGGGGNYGKFPEQSDTATGGGADGAADDSADPDQAEADDSDQAEQSESDSNGADGAEDESHQGNDDSAAEANSGPESGDTADDDGTDSAEADDSASGDQGADDDSASGADQSRGGESGDTTQGSSDTDSGSDTASDGGITGTGDINNGADSDPEHADNSDSSNGKDSGSRPAESQSPENNSDDFEGDGTEGGTDGNNTDPGNQGSDAGVSMAPGGGGVPNKYFEEMSVEDIKKAIEKALGHDDHIDYVGNQDPGNLEGKNSNDSYERALKDAVLQAESFDDFSANVAGCNVFRAGDANQGEAMDGSGYGNVPTETPDYKVVASAMMKARKIFSESKMDKNVRNQKKGKISRRTLGARGALNDDRLFQRKLRADGIDYEIVIGMDMSGSVTWGPALKDIRTLGYYFSEMLNSVGIPFSTYAHTTGTSIDGNWAGMTQNMYELKGLNKPWDTVAKNRVLSVYPEGGSLDGHNFEFYRKIMQRSRAKKRVIIYFTDGNIPETNHQEELPILLRELKTCKREGISVLCVGVTTDSPTKYGLDTLLVEDSSDIKKVLDELERRITK